MQSGESKAIKVYFPALHLWRIRRYDHFLKKLKTELLYDPAILFLGIPKE